MKNIFKKSFGAFTMAEILLSLTIIGVVAAITLPSLTGNINERTWATQKKALFARMAQAFPLLDSINTFDNAESFIAGGLNTVTKINNVCAAGNIEDCGINVSTIMTMNAGVLSFPDGWVGLGLEGDTTTTTDTTASGSGELKDPKMAAFETGNGESVVLWYNPNCVPDQETAPTTTTEGGGYEDWFQYVCVNMMYDLNNNKGPNSIGKDIGFITVFYPMDSIVVAPIPDVSASSTVSTCSSDEYRVPNKYEAASLAANEMFITGQKAGTTGYITSSKASTSSTTYRLYTNGTDFAGSTDNLTASNGTTRCIKR